MQAVDCSNKELSCPKKFEAAPRTQSFGSSAKVSIWYHPSHQVAPLRSGCKERLSRRSEAYLVFCWYGEWLLDKLLAVGYTANLILNTTGFSTASCCRFKMKVLVVVQIRYRCIHLWSILFRAMFYKGLLGCLPMPACVSSGKVQNAAS